MHSLIPSPVLTRRRIQAAFAIAILTDAAQLALGPLGWVFVDQTLDVVAMVLTICLLGFHPLLLPTFLMEFLPAIDMLPTWTGSVAIVVALRNKQAQPRVSSSTPGAGPIIDV